MLSIPVDDDIELAEVRDAFAPRYVELAEANYDHLYPWLAWPPHVKTVEDFRGFIKRCRAEHESGKAITFGLQYQQQLAGNITYKVIDHDLKKTEIGYWIGREFQGKGIVSRACRRLIDYAFDTLDLHKVEMRVATGNRPSRAVCTRLGMALEGIITNAECLHGTIHDHAIYGLHRKADRR